MKIGILSDIHVDINHQSGKDVVTPALCTYINNSSLNLFIIAGDVASDYVLTLKTIETLENETGIPILFVPGNHDIWTENHPDLTSWEIYKKLNKHPHNLAGSPYTINDDWIVIGDLGWYDYKFGTSTYSLEDFNRMRFEDRVWQDSIMAKWDRPTIEMNDFFLRKLEKQLSRINTGNIIAVTHVLPVADFTVQNPSPMWKYLNAFLGSPDYGTLFEKHPGVRYSIAGHVHYRKTVKKNGTVYICNCLGYSTEWRDTNDPFTEIPRAVKTIEI